MATTTRTVKEQLELAADIIGGNAWGIDKLKPRIYVKTRRDTKAYFDFADDASYTSPDDPADAVHGLGGAAFRVYIDDCGQHPNWYAGEKRKLVEANWLRSLALSAFIGCDDEQLAREIMEMDDITAAQVDEAAGHLVNGRITEARQALGL